MLATAGWSCVCFNCSKKVSRRVSSFWIWRVFICFDSLARLENCYFLLMHRRIIQHFSMLHQCVKNYTSAIIVGPMIRWHDRLFTIWWKLNRDSNFKDPKSSFCGEIWCVKVVPVVCCFGSNSDMVKLGLNSGLHSEVLKNCYNSAELNCYNLARTQ